jgi:uncharacterized protein YbjT (DUF2867 family)
MKQINKILVVGGTGKTGRRVVERLHNHNLQVRIGSRNSQIPFDWTNRTTWATSLQDMDAIYVTYQPDLAVPNAADDIEAFSAQAVAAGVRRLVLLSGRGEDAAHHCERLLQKSGAESVIVRANWFNQNFDEGFLRDAIIGGQIALPAGDVKEPFLDVEDIADVVTAALTDDRHIGQVYELSGPRLMTL